MQRKIVENDVLIQLSEQGFSGKEIAAQTGISPAAVSKRLARIRLQQQEPPESFSRLTTKQQRMVAEMATGKNQTDACMTAYDCIDRRSAKALAAKVMRDEDMHVALGDLLAQEGIGRRRRVQRMAELIESRDTSAVCRMLELAAKMDGSLIERVEIGYCAEDLRKLFELIPNGKDDSDIIDVTPYGVENSNTCGIVK
jgi:predicted transcriptional regulator